MSARELTTSGGVGARGGRDAAAALGGGVDGGQLSAGEAVVCAGTAPKAPAGLRHRGAGRDSNAARAATRAASASSPWCARNTAGGSTSGSGRRWRPSTWPAKTASRCITTRCAGGCWRRGCGVAPRKRSPHRRRRERKAHFGELVQLDGSFHAWFEDRGPHSCLLTMVDDATGRSSGSIRRAGNDLGGGRGAAAVDRAVRGAARALYRLEERLCAGPECGGARHRGPRR